MSSWLILVALIAFSMAAFWLLGLRGAMLKLAAASALLGASGYALQGRPGLPGSPPTAAASKEVIPLAGARHAFFGDFTPSEHWLLMSESLASRGQTADAAGILRSAVREHPGDPQLWIGLGNALVDHAGVLTPAAQFAYQRAAELAPGHPAAPFFLGLALARSGDPADALKLWKPLLSEAPADASWRPLVEQAIAAFSPNPT
ncbi:MAG: tetratricopeptide repeat protein [Sphingomicrobium sp.]